MGLGFQLGGGGGGSGLIEVRRTLTAAELQGINGESYTILESPGEGKSYVVRELFLHRGAGARMSRSPRFQPRFALAFVPEGQTAKLNYNSVGGNINADLFSSYRFYNVITSSAYVDFVQLSHSLGENSDIVIGIYGTVRTTEQVYFTTIGGSLEVGLYYTIEDV